LIDFLQYIITGIFIGMLYALIALAINVIYRAGRILNFAQGEMVILGGFLVWWFASSLQLPLWLGLAAGFAVSILIGLLIERGIFRPMIGQPIFSLVMTTIGLMILLRGVMLVLWGAQQRPFPAVFPTKPLLLGPIILNQAVFWGGVISIVVLALISFLFEHTKQGLKLTVVAEDHRVAQSLGISVRAAIAIAWAIGGGLSTFAALVFLNGASLDFLASEIGLRALPVALLAGLESIWGLALAGIIVGVGEAVAGAYLDPYLGGGGFSQTFPYVLMLFIVLIRPQGLFGWKIIERV
jgi:branched-chain amino acid transport system permease protein